MARLISTLPQKLLSMDASFDQVRQCPESQLSEYKPDYAPVRQLLRLLQDPAYAVQLSSYQLLRRVIGKHVSDLVVEAELDVEDKLEIGLPAALVSALENRPDSDEPSQVRGGFSPSGFRRRRRLTVENDSCAGHGVLAELAARLQFL